MAMIKEPKPNGRVVRRHQTLAEAKLVPLLPRLSASAMVPKKFGNPKGTGDDRDPNGDARVEEACARATERLSGGVWTFAGDTLIRALRPAPAQ